jgi:phage shock protein PspC (stress-responsive transcriptional regulator)
MEPKRLYRSLTDRKIAGVAGGLGEYFVIDPLLLRLAFVILLVAGGGGFLLYLILWIVTPDNPVKILNTNQPDQNFQQATYDAPDFTGERSNAEPASSPSTPIPQTKERNRGSFIGGMVLITLGVLFLADEFIPQVNFGDLWPVILIVIGVGLLINTITKRNRNTNQY